MRWNKRLKVENGEGDRRTVRRFLILPKCLNSQWRWLEFAYILQVNKRIMKIRGSPRSVRQYSVLQWVSEQWWDNK